MSSEHRIYDLIDELWDKYDGEPWLTELAAEGKGGLWLYRAAEEILATGSDKETIAALRRGEHRE